MNVSISNSISFYILSFLLFSCASNGQPVSKTVDAQELKQLMEQNVQLVDVRTPNEFSQGRIKGAKLINYRDSDFASQISALDKDQPIAIYCAAGGRSTRATKILEEAGFKTIYNYTGGFGDWKSRGEEIENE